HGEVSARSARPVNFFAGHWAGRRPDEESHMHKLAIAAAMSIAAAVFPIASSSASFAAGAAAPDTNEGFHVCLTSHRRACLDVKDSHYALHQPVLVHGVSGAHALGWNYIKNYIGQGVCAGQSRCGGTFWPFTSHALDRKYYKDAVDLFPP